MKIIILFIMKIIILLVVLLREWLNGLINFSSGDALIEFSSVMTQLNLRE